jgi:hypothetical protein
MESGPGFVGSFHNTRRVRVNAPGGPRLPHGHDRGARTTAVRWGAPSRPGLRLIAAHGGGTITMLASWIDALSRAAPSFRDRIDTPPSETLRHTYVDALLSMTRSPSVSPLPSLGRTGCCLPRIIRMTSAIRLGTWRQSAKPCPQSTMRASLDNARRKQQLGGEHLRGGLHRRMALTFQRAAPCIGEPLAAL